MAETVYLLDGSMEVVFDEKDVFLERLLREKLGNDASRFFVEYIRELKEEAEYADQAQQEADRIADGYLSLCREAADDFQKLQQMLDAPRLDRTALRKYAERSWRKIRNEI